MRRYVISGEYKSICIPPESWSHTTQNPAKCTYTQLIDSHDINTALKWVEKILENKCEEAWNIFLWYYTTNIYYEDITYKDHKIYMSDTKELLTMDSPEFMTWQEKNWYDLWTDWTDGRFEDPDKMNDHLNMNLNEFDEYCMSVYLDANDM